MDFLKRNKSLVRFIVVHKNSMTRLLFEKKIIDEEKDKPNWNKPKNRAIYFKKIDGLNVLIFSRFIANGGFKCEDVKKVIQDLNI